MWHSEALPCTGLCCPVDEELAQDSFLVICQVFLERLTRCLWMDFPNVLSRTHPASLEGHSVSLEDSPSVSRQACQVILEGLTQRL